MNNVIKISHTNIGSLRSVEKVDHIRCAFEGLSDIITISETWLCSKITSHHLTIPGYHNPFRRDRLGDTGYG